MFDDVEIRPQDRRLVIKGRSAALGTRAFDVLLALVAQRHRVVSKGELIDTVWPNVVVEPNNLAVQIGTLRKLLGAAAITTIPGRGYKFSAAAVRLMEDSVPGVSTAVVAPVDRAAVNEPLAPGVPWNEKTTELIGRSADIEKISALMCWHRVVTLTGSSGIGKTRVAQRLVGDTSHRFAHGSAWVELAAASDTPLVVDAIARAMKLDLRGNAPLVGLLHALRPLNLLLVIDNVEQVVGEVACVVQAIIADAPGVAVLLTSQIPLRISEEKVVRLLPLALPSRDVPAASAIQFGAVELFVERAKAMDSGFTLSEENVGPVIDICRRLDGIPLAIDMAASRVALLGVQELARAIDNQLSLLASSRRDQQARHQTLRRALEWSHGLLNARERIVLRRLSVFAGSFPLELALDVVASPAEGTDEWDVLDALTELIDRSLVIVDSAEPPRYRLLESTKAFALEQLALADEVDAWRQRHAKATCKMALQLFAQHLHDWDRSQSRLAAELDNTREALAWALDHDPLTAVLLVPPISCGLVTSSIDSLEIWTATEKLLSDDLPPAARAQWATSASIFKLPAWQHRRLSWARTALELWTLAGDRAGQQMASMVIARLVEMDDAVEHRQLLNRIQQHDSPDMAPGIRMFKARLEAHAAVTQGAPERAILAFEDAFCWAVTSRNSFVQDVILLEIASAEHAANRLADAVRRGRELADRFRGTRKTLFLTSALCNLAGACLELHDHVQARQALVEAWPLAQDHGFAEDCCLCLALLCATEGKLEEAASLLGTADALHASVSGPRAASKRRIAQQAERLVSEQLDADAFLRRRSQGRLMSMDQALALGRGKVERRGSRLSADALSADALSAEAPAQNAGWSVDTPAPAVSERSESAAVRATFEPSVSPGIASSSW